MGAFAHNPSDPTIDAWLRRHQPRTELALRCSMREKFNAAKNNAGFTARIDELFTVINPTDDEYAEILRRARELGSALAKILDE